MSNRSGPGRLWPNGLRNSCLCCLLAHVSGFLACTYVNLLQKMRQGLSKRKLEKGVGCFCFLYFLSVSNSILANQVQEFQALAIYFRLKRQTGVRRSLVSLLIYCHGLRPLYPLWGGFLVTQWLYVKLICMRKEDVASNVARFSGLTLSHCLKACPFCFGASGKVSPCTKIMCCFNIPCDTPAWTEVSLG
jgi:hypothetical protein